MDARASVQRTPLRPFGYRDQTIRPISEVRLRFNAGGARDVFADIVQESLRWLQPRAGAPLPAAAWRGESFESELLGAQPVAAVRLAAPRPHWTVHLDDADRTVPRRRWITEIGVQQETATDVGVGVRLVCSTRGEQQSYVPSIPGVVRQIVDLGGATCEGRAVTAEPTVISTAQDVEALIQLLLSGERQLHVVVCSLPDDSGDLSRSVTPIRDLHVRTLGAAHVFALTRAASFVLTNRLGMTYSVFEGAVRTYSAGFDPVQDLPYRHPLCFRARIEAWPGGPARFADFIIGQALARSAQVADHIQKFVTFSEAKRLEAESRLDMQRAAGATDRELLELFGQENDILKGRLEEADALLAIADSERQGIERARDEVESDNFALRARIAALVVEQRMERAVVEEVPDNLEGFREWCAAHLSGQVEVLPRAFTGAKKSDYHDPRLIYRALLLLRDHYVPMKREGGLELKADFDHAAAELGLTEEPTFSSGAARWGQEGDTYMVTFRGREQRLDRHLTKGSDRETRFCFRLYFFWDEETQQVVVGWLPSHLRTRAT